MSWVEEREGFKETLSQALPSNIYYVLWCIVHNVMNNRRVETVKFSFSVVEYSKQDGG